MFARTERLLLRPSWEEDSSALYHAINDEGLVRNLAKAPWPYKLSDAQWFTAQPQNPIYPKFLLWKYTDYSPALIGSCGINDSEDGVELGYWIARPYWGLGYATEAARAVINIARAIGHKHLHASYYTDNPASGNVLRKVGFHSTGRIEPRYSEGRKASASCVIMDQKLGESDNSGNSSDNPEDAVNNMCRNSALDVMTSSSYSAQLKAA